NPTNRAALCASCHVGNAAEGKFVTHAMYAAGHPLLPSLEVATFSDEMPRHWQYIKEKPAAIQKLLGFPPGEVALERTKLVLTSGVATFQSAMDLLARQAQACAKAKEENG